MRLSRANTSFWLIWLSALLWCFINSADDPGSIFFRAKTAYRRRYSAYREIEAQVWLEEASIKPLVESSTKAKLNEFLCIGIPSVNRPTAFLETSLGSLTDSLSEAERASIHIVVLLADPDPKKHTSYGKPWLSRLADDVITYSYEGESVWPVREPDDAYRELPRDLTGKGRGGARAENMLLDHSVLLEACQQHGSPYFALIQDDVIASKDWLQRLWRGIAKLEKSPKENEQDWLYLRLFHNEGLMGWNNEEVLQYVKIIAFMYVLVGVIILVVMRCCRRRRRVSRTRAKSVGSSTIRPPQTHSFTYIAALALGLWIPASITLFFMAGRLTFHRVTHRSPYVREMSQYGCCAQGLVFPQRHMDGMMTLLREPPYDYPVDMAIESYALRNGLTKWALDPSILQHIGRTESSEHGKSNNIWNFSFERR